MRLKERVAAAVVLEGKCEGTLLCCISDELELEHVGWLAVAIAEGGAYVAPRNLQNCKGNKDKLTKYQRGCLLCNVRCFL